ncbi:predicted protein [Chaetomium globosum CBS 148.51]|uniref:Uncharacterized protein n=1 Tax=Chaetomium globosum (strain ATCC 6205 / CBS 148.51 / DSM 1962 / NBRC 6347 / NRRL 1970) TaxID=306901 RepID=Q2GQQ2_CHAGB|nr:uncharacterized protein CHGG_09702 [Chaetomium globosum CBS 148.51]EAQ83298.1 predicted protein [Chaetomium globosum CBS 148.51]
MLIQRRLHPSRFVAIRTARAKKQFYFIGNPQKQSQELLDPVSGGMLRDKLPCKVRVPRQCPCGCGSESTAGCEPSTCITPPSPEIGGVLPADLPLPPRALAAH